ncbi:MAG: CPBP family intramembrane metalloprotease [Anaerolineales bacterium]|nr:CPBP family intramembrane metalloprotease [Anaerolineales bacterium]
MTQQLKTPERSLFQMIFLSPEEPRLRAGWRLLLHTVFYLAVLITLSFGALLFYRGELGAAITSISPAIMIELVSILSATYLARRFLDYRSFSSLGLQIDRSTVTDLIIGFFIPALMMALIFLIEYAADWTHFQGWSWQTVGIGQSVIGLLGGLAAFVLVGISEEILSRGYHLQNILEGLNIHWALFLSSSVFALLHFLNPSSSPMSTLGLLAAGYFLAYGWVRTRRLWLPIGLHIGWNFFEGNVFGFQVSGLDTFRLLLHTPSGPEFITGGAFGPEAGLIAIPAMLLGAWLIKLYTREHVKIRSNNA